MFCTSFLSFYNKKTGGHAARINGTTLLELFPQIIVGAFALHGVLGAILVEHTLEDLHIAGGHVSDLKDNIECKRVNLIPTAPLSASDEHHGILVGNFRGEIDQQAKVLSWRDFFLAVQFKSFRTDI